VTFSDLTLSILSTISSKGPEGVSGVALSRQYGLAPKDTFYHTKKLVNEGLMCVSASSCFLIVRGL
jgi:DNA-binding IclR family transcriptional regulator